MAEVPIIFTDRREGQSKMSRKVILESVLMPWRLRFNSDTKTEERGWETPGARDLGAIDGRP